MVNSVLPLEWRSTFNSSQNDSSPLVFSDMHSLWAHVDFNHISRQCNKHEGNIVTPACRVSWKFWSIGLPFVYLRKGNNSKETMLQCQIGLQGSGIIWFHQLMIAFYNFSLHLSEAKRSPVLLNFQLSRVAPSQSPIIRWFLLRP